MDQSDRSSSDHSQQIRDAANVDTSSHHWIQLTALQFAGSFAIQHGSELMTLKQLIDSSLVMNVTRFDRRAAQPPVVSPPRTNHLARITIPEVSEGIVTGNSGNSGHQQRQRKRGVNNHNRANWGIRRATIRSRAVSRSERDQEDWQSK
jgi:hypothetical protein